jgi:hypothetical protein
VRRVSEPVAYLSQGEAVAALQTRDGRSCTEVALVVSDGLIWPTGAGREAGPTTDHARQPRPALRAANLLALATAAEVADLIARRDVALERLAPALPAGPVITGMTFDGSTDLQLDDVNQPQLTRPTR